MFKNLFGKMFGKKKNVAIQPRTETDIDREISALYSVVVDVIGSDRLVLQAGKMDALRIARRNYSTFRNDGGHRRASAD